MVDDSTLRGIMKGSLWLFIGVTVFNVVGFLYWIIASLFVTPVVVGSVSAILSLESLIVNIFSLGIPIGIRRFIGAYWGHDNKDKTAQYLSTAAAFSIIVNCPALLLVLFLSFQNATIFGLTQLELIFVAILIALDFWPSILASFFISILRTKVTTIANSCSSIVKIIFGVILLQLGFGFLGILVSIISASLARSMILVAYTSRLSREIGFSLYRHLNVNALKEILHASVASWIPNTLLVLGQTFGILIIYGYVGGNETGLYYLAFAVSTVVYNLPGSIQSLMFPVISGMDHGKEDAAAEGIRLSLATAVPFALILVIYPYVPFLLLGSIYEGASSILAILVLGVVAYPIVSGYGNYVYALGKYTHVVAIDLVSTLVRLTLYIALVVPLGGLGAAIAYVLGIVGATIPLIFSATKTGFSFRPFTYTKILLIPAFLSLAMYLLQIPWFLGVTIILLLTSIAYARLGVITKNDLKQMALAFLSPESVARVHTHTKRIVMALFGD